MSSTQQTKYTQFYNTYVRKLEDEVKRNETLLGLLQEKGSLEAKTHILKSLEIAKAKLETCHTIDVHARQEMDKEAKVVKVKTSTTKESRRPQLRSDSKKHAATNGIDLLIQASLEPSTESQASSCSSIKRRSDGVVFKVKQRVSFVDPTSGFYVDGVVKSIRGPHLVEVGYWKSRWASEKYNQVVPVDKLLGIVPIKKFVK